MTDKIGLLKKIEIKFQNLVEMRKVFTFFDNRLMQIQEKKIKDKIKTDDLQRRQEREREVFDAQAAKTLQKIEAKKSLKVSKNIRMVQRSKKAEVQMKTDNKVETPPEVLLMRRYFAHMPENWEQ